MSKEYTRKKDTENFKKLQAQLLLLPPFCREYFIGVAQRTSILTRLNYAHDLSIFFEFAIQNTPAMMYLQTKDITLTHLEDLDVSDIELFLAYLDSFERKETLHSNSLVAKARKLSSLRSLFKYFFRKDKLTRDVTAKVPTPKLRDKNIIRLEIHEIKKILDIAEHGNTALTTREQAFHKLTATRDLAILTLFLGTGIRISELVGLNLQDFDFDNGDFRVTRKGGKTDTLFFSNEIGIALADYLKVRKSAETDTSALFLSLQNKRISTRAVQNLVKKYAKQAAPLKAITPHKLRSTYGTNLYRETGDIYVVAEVLGHKDINTTKKHYAAMSEDIKRKAANKVILREKD